MNNHTNFVVKESLAPKETVLHGEQNANNAYAGAVVFTVPERSDLYAAVLGDDIDFRYEDYESVSFETDLINIAIQHGTLVIIDTDFFKSTSKMVAGLKHYYDVFLLQRKKFSALSNVSNSSQEPRIIVVFPQVNPDMQLLHFVTQYCMIPDVLVAAPNPNMINKLNALLKQPATRHDVLHLMTDFFESSSSTKDIDINSLLAPFRIGRGYTDICHVKNILENPDIKVDFSAEKGEIVYNFRIGINTQNEEDL